MLIFLRTMPAFLACIPLAVFSQTGLATGGARSAGFGNASVAIKDHWSVINNIAASTYLTIPTAACAVENHFALSNLSTGTFIAVWPFKKFTAALSLSKFGDHLYSEQSVGVGAAHKISGVSLGAKINYFQISGDETPTRGTFIGEFGGLVNVTKQIVFGAHVYNINQSTIRIAGTKTELPVIMKAGLSYAPHSKIILNIETWKEIPYSASFKAGIEYSVVKKLQLRTGISTFPFTGSFGAGFHHLSFGADYAFSLHQTLGVIQQFSIYYSLKKK